MKYLLILTLCITCSWCYSNDSVEKNADGKSMICTESIDVIDKNIQEIEEDSQDVESDIPSQITNDPEIEHLIISHPYNSGNS